MQLGGLGIQWCIKSEKAYQHLKKTDDNVDDLPKRKSNKKTPFTAKKFK